MLRSYQGITRAEELVHVCEIRCAQVVRRGRPALKSIGGAEDGSAGHVGQGQRRSAVDLHRAGFSGRPAGKGHIPEVTKLTHHHEIGCNVLVLYQVSGDGIARDGEDCVGGEVAAGAELNDASCIFLAFCGIFVDAVEGIIDDGDFLAGNRALKVDRAAAIFKAAIGDERRSRVNVLEGIGVVDIGKSAICDGEDPVGVIPPICLLAIGTDNDLLKGAVGDCHIPAVQKLEFRVSNLVCSIGLVF